MAQLRTENATFVTAPVPMPMQTTAVRHKVYTSVDDTRTQTSIMWAYLRLLAAYCWLPWLLLLLSSLGATRWGRRKIWVPTFKNSLEKVGSPCRVVVIGSRVGAGRFRVRVMLSWLMRCHRCGIGPRTSACNVERWLRWCVDSRIVWNVRQSGTEPDSCKDRRHRTDRPSTYSRCVASLSLF